MIIARLQKFTPFLFFFLFVNFSSAQKQYSRDNFPSKEDVFAKVKGNDEKETILKQAGVFRFLYQEINDVFLRDKSMKEKELQNEYEQSMKILRSKYDKEIATLEDKENRGEYFVKTETIDNELENFVINNLFDEKTKVQYLEQNQKNKTRTKARIEELKNEAERIELESNEKIKNGFKFTSLLLLSFIFALVIPIALMFFVGKRKANRTNKYGTQEFSSYENMVGSNIIENFMGVLIAISVIIGIYFLIIAF